MKRMTGPAPTLPRIAGWTAMASSTASNAPRLPRLILRGSRRRSRLGAASEEDVLLRVVHHGNKVVMFRRSIGGGWPP